MKPTKHYRNIEAKTLSKVSASGSSGLFRPFSSKRGGSSIVSSDASDPGDSSRWCLLRLLPDSLELCELSSSRCRLRLLCPRCSWSLSSPSGEGSREGSRAGSSCGSRLNLTLFSSSGGGGVGRAGLGLRDFSTGPIQVSTMMFSTTGWQRPKPTTCRSEVFVLVTNMIRGWSTHITVRTTGLAIVSIVLLRRRRCIRVSDMDIAMRRMDVL